MGNGTGLQVIIDLIQSIIKFLGRAAVQRQLLAIFLILLISWYLSRPLVSGLGKIYGRWLARQRRKVAAQGARSVTEDARVRSYVNKLRPLLQIADTITFPLLAILLTGLTIMLFDALGWFSGLLTDTLTLLALFFAYRLFIGLSYTLFDKQKVIHYQVRLFSPLFIVIIVLSIVSSITELSILASAPLFPLFDGFVTLGTLFLATIGLFLWIMAISLVIDLLQPMITSRTRVDPRAVEAWLILLRYLLIAAGIIYAFQLIGFSATTLAAVLGGLAIGVGFALEDVLKNFLGGIILLFEGSVRPGDWIEVNGTVGKVERLRIRSTIVRTDDDVEYIVPNQDYLSSTIVAYTQSTPGLMLKIPVTVSDDVNIREVQDLLRQVAESCPDIHPEPAPTVKLVDFNGNTLTFELRAWIIDIPNKGQIAADLRVMIVEALAQQGIK
ncbi:MAG: mechanosensitive ion channel [Candidatus Promineifilaceae bacterium]|nr:mechanosensitive ion channel [Candidatus Promineifilaceae bacterium]